ncbi:Hypothetical predicted protein [Podarcis lilfordi]|uniref:Uncharacterized protein n=1 Tax=Podarcis lilfordi TaxID=74358 RepID=A0AA35PEY2_9SAUR|nr:Hypothetical predicted protein [Podarcis lilfordi]
MKEILPHLTPLSMGDLGPPLRPHLLPHQKYPAQPRSAFSFSPKVTGQLEKPHLDSRSLVFELDPCGGNGKVCLVYRNTKSVVTPHSEIWFLD